MALPHESKATDLRRCLPECLGPETLALLAAYAANRQPGEGFGDFVVRTGVVKATQFGLDFHA